MPSSPPIPPCARSPPAIELKWASAAFPFLSSALPPLPRIQTPSLELQARTSKNFVGFKAGRVSNYNDEDELASYRRLEWLGDMRLNAIFTLELFRRFPNLLSGSLSKFRSALTCNHTFSHIARAYDLDTSLLEPPPPQKPSKGWRSLAQTQNVVADLLEAHMGALVLEGRERDVEEWVKAFLDGQKVELDEKAQELTVHAVNATEFSRRAGVKRKREEMAFEGGDEYDPEAKRQRVSFLEDCPAKAEVTPPLPHWDDRLSENFGWHSHLVYDAATVGCGSAHKQSEAREAALSSFFRRLQASPALRDFLSKPGAFTTPPSRTPRPQSPSAPRLAQACSVSSAGDSSAGYSIV
ncbi:hypothetical protein JCM10213v2_001799 [Rhodosporidiobolus nylandii]